MVTASSTACSLFNDDDDKYLHNNNDCSTRVVINNNANGLNQGPSKKILQYYCVPLNNNK